MMRKKNKTLIKKLCNDSIDEAFLVCAMEKYCKEVLADETDWGNQALINKDLWQVIAKQNLETIKEHYE